MLAALARWFAMERVDRPEHLDSGEASLREARQTLAELEQINRWLGGRAALRRFVFPHLRGMATGKPLRVLDIACGSAGVSAEIVRWARARGIAVQVVALDFLDNHLRIARESTSSYPEIQLLQADARRLPFAARSFDLAVSTLFLHHLDENELAQALASFRDVCRGTLVLNDLVRGRTPLLFFNAVMPLLAESAITIDDGRVSIARAFRPNEMRRILRRAGLESARIHTHGLYYRMSIVSPAAPSPTPSP
jgi:ubiquinone/menaquinone biosynthesis C-methylase UbiE